MAICQMDNQYYLLQLNNVVDKKNKDDTIKVLKQINFQKIFIVRFKNVQSLISIESTENDTRLMCLKLKLLSKNFRL
jgi:hypothetical protein